MALGGDDAIAAVADDPGEPFVRLGDQGDPFHGTLIPAASVDDEPAFVAAGEPDWRHAGADDPRPDIEAAVASVKRARRRPNRNSETTPN